MDFKRENPACSFTVPDKVTVRMQLNYFSMASLKPSPDLWEKLWEAAKTIITDWQCELFPDFKTSLDDMTDPQITSTIVWAAIEVKKHIDALEIVPKN